MGQSSGHRLGLDRFWNRLRSHSEHRDIRRDSHLEEPATTFHEPVLQSDIWGKTITMREAIQIAWARLEEQAGGGVASREWGEVRQEKVALP